MKKAVLILFLCFSSFWAHAGDTLTRAQIYNFNVGDTFDYKYGAVSFEYGYLYANYLHIVITNNYYSQDSDTLFIFRRYQCAGYGCADTAINTDMLIIDSLKTYQFFYKSYILDSPQLSITDSSQYYGRTINTIWGKPNNYEQIFGAGLGRVEAALSAGGGRPDCCLYDSTLIYYSKGAEKWGTPYYIAEGVDAIDMQRVSVTLKPTVNDGHFQIALNNANGSQFTFVVYDLTGREVKRASFNPGVTDIAMNNPETGMYVWKAFAQGNLIQTGKMIVN